MPCILGYDIAGVIDGVGPGVTGLAPGDRVMAMTHFPDGAGGYAELVVIDAALVAPISAATSFADAAATPLAAGTAHLVLARLGLPRPPAARARRQRWCRAVPAPAAAAAGIITIGVGRKAMHAQMRGLGAAACIDYTREDVPAPARALAGGPVDAIADLVGGSLARSACAALRPGGQIAAIATPDLDLDPLLDANITFHGVLIQDDGDRTRALADLLGGRVAARHQPRSPLQRRRRGPPDPGSRARRRKDRPRPQRQPLIRSMTAEQEAPRVVSATREIAAGAGRIFELIADPAAQPRWDGNDNLASAPAGQRVRRPGDVFAMMLTRGEIRENHVVEFEEGRRIAWTPAEPGKVPPGHLWRWELEPVDASRTRVTHIYDWTRLTDEGRLPARSRHHGGSPPRFARPARGAGRGILSPRG